MTVRELLRTVRDQSLRIKILEQEVRRLRDCPAQVVRLWPGGHHYVCSRPHIDDSKPFGPWRQGFW